MVTYECYGNCPNCGAPIESDICEYCGTRFRKKNDVISRFTGLSQERLKLENELLAAKTRMIADREQIKVLYKEALKTMRSYHGLD